VVVVLPGSMVVMVVGMAVAVVVLVTVVDELKLVDVFVVPLVLGTAVGVVPVALTVVV